MLPHRTNAFTYFKTAKCKPCPPSSGNDVVLNHCGLPGLFLRSPKTLGEEEAKKSLLCAELSKETWAVLVSLMASMWMLQTTFFLAAL